MRIIAISFILYVAGFGSAFANNSSFQRSCQNVNLHLQEYNVWVQAECGDGNGGVIWSELALSGYYNDHGNLMRNSDASSSFQRSCAQAWLEWDDNSVKLVAICGDGRGGELQSSIFVHDIHNRNGYLVHGW